MSVNKGRLKGEVEKIEAMFRAGISLTAIAKYFGVNHASIFYYINKDVLPRKFVVIDFHPDKMRLTDISYKPNCFYKAEDVMESLKFGLVSGRPVSLDTYTLSVTKLNTSKALSHKEYVMNEHNRLVQTMTTKVCADCLVPKPLSDYIRDPAHVKCKNCFNSRVISMLGPDAFSLTRQEIRAIAKKKGYRFNVCRFFGLPESKE